MWECTIINHTVYYTVLRLVPVAPHVIPPGAVCYARRHHGQNHERLRTPENHQNEPNAFRQQQTTYDRQQQQKQQKKITVIDI